MTGMLRIILLSVLLAYALPAQGPVMVQDNFGLGNGVLLGGLLQIQDGSFLAPRGDNGEDQPFKQPTLIVRLAPDGTLTTLANGTNARGLNPSALIQGRDGNIYGNMSTGGANGKGTVFQLSLSTGFRVLHNFSGTDGDKPIGRLLQADDGYFYGATGAGGTFGLGTLFRINSTGQFTSLHSFRGSDGRAPVGDLVEVGGSFFGSALNGGASTDGTLFRFSVASGLKAFYNFPVNHGCPTALTLGIDGQLYGVTQEEAFVPEECIAFDGSGLGTLFRVDPASLAYSQLVDFSATPATFPSGPVLQASDGDLYGVLSEGGDLTDTGAIFRFSPVTQALSFSFFKESGTGAPCCELLQTDAGAIWGVTQGFVNLEGFSPGSAIFSLGDPPPAPSPTIYKLIPASGNVGSTISIRGDHFLKASQVSFNGTPAKFLVTSTNWIIAVVPTGATSGLVQITNPGGTGISRSPFQIK